MRTDTILFIILLTLAILFFLVEGSFVDESVAIKALQKQGFTDINITGKEWLFVGFRGCSEDDSVKFTAIAKNPRNETVEVYVCSGWLFKGSTVRS